MEFTPEELGKVRLSSRRAALITLTGVIVIAGVLGFSFLKLMDLDDKIQARTQEKEKLEKRIEDLGSRVGNLETTVAIARKEAGRLEAQKEELREQSKELEEKLNRAKAEEVKLAKRAEELARETAELEREKEKLKNDIQALEEWREVAVRDSEVFSANLRKATRSSPNYKAPIEAIIKPRASAKKLGPKTYDFSLWVEVPPERRQEIAKVLYHFPHPTLRNAGKASSESRNGFKVGYTGWGAVREVIITVHLKNGKSFKRAFDMARAINEARSEIPAKGEERIPEKN